jgi:hypothetical protein
MLGKVNAGNSSARLAGFGTTKVVPLRKRTFSAAGLAAVARAETTPFLETGNWKLAGRCYPVNFFNRLVIFSI